MFILIELVIKSVLLFECRLLLYIHVVLFYAILCYCECLKTIETSRIEFSIPQNMEIESKITKIEQVQTIPWGKNTFSRSILAAILDFQVPSRADLLSMPMRITVPNLALVSQFARFFP